MLKKLYLLLFVLFMAAGNCLANIVTVTVGSGGNFFSPASFIINPGDTVRWIWVNGYHNTSSVTRPTGATNWYSNITSADTTYSYVPMFSGLYTYTCTHHSGMDGQFFVTGCTYPSKPVINTSGGITACAGDTILLSTAAQPGVTYQWINGVTTVPGGNTYTLAATTSGAYKVLVNRCGVDSVSDPFPVTIQSPAPSFTYTHSGLDYTFTNTTVPLTGTDFIWSFSDGYPDQTTVNVFRTFTLADTYVVSLKASDAATLCTDTFFLSIPVTADTNDTTDTITTSIEPGILNIPKGENVYIYPNPASDMLYILADSEIEIRLMDISGSLVQQTAFKKRRAHVLHIGELPDGLYFLHIHGRGIVSVRKIWIRH